VNASGAHRNVDTLQARGYPYKRSRLIALHSTKDIRKRSALALVAGRAEDHNAAKRNIFAGGVGPAPETQILRYLSLA
jgi:hypothetical protein